MKVKKQQPTINKVSPKKAYQMLDNLTLPDSPEDPIENINEATFLIYGENKIGKTSLCSMFPEPLFLMFEPGGRGLRIARRQVNSWKEFVRYIDLIVDSDKFKTVVIDPISICYRSLVDHICEKEVVDDLSEIGWGKGWKAVEDEFIRQIRRLSSTHRGVIFLGHPEQVEFEKRTGGVYHKIVPRMMKQARSFIASFVDVIAYYGYYGNQRMLTIEGSDEVDAGSRLKYKFKTPSGERIHSIPMSDENDETFDESKAYENLIRAFNNQQTDRCIPMYRTMLTDKRTEKKRK